MQNKQSEMMHLTKNRLPETDLARVALFDTDQKLKALRRMRSFRPPITYKPIRKHLADALSVQRTLPMLVGGVTREQLIENVDKDSQSVAEADANTEVAGLLYDFIHDNNIQVIEQRFAPLKLSQDYAATYWTDAVLVWGDRVIVINTDFRRSAGYSADAQRFAFSVANERVRKFSSEFADIELGLLNFATNKAGDRTVSLITDARVELLSYETLREVSEDTLRVWRQVIDERARDTRTDAANDDKSGDTLFTWANSQGETG